MANEVEIHVKVVQDDDFDAVANATRARYRSLGDNIRRDMGASQRASMRDFTRAIRDLDTPVRGSFSRIGRESAREFNRSVGSRKQYMDLSHIMANMATFSMHGFKSSLRNSLVRGGPAVSGPLLVVMLAAVAAVMPLVGAAASGLFITAFGLGLAGLFGAFSFQMDKVQKRWQEFTAELGSSFKEISEPFQDVWIESMAILEQSLDSVKGALRESAEIMGPAVIDLVRGLAGAMKELAEVSPAVSRAFAAIMDQLGPQLPEMFREIAGAIYRVAESISDNPDTFVMLIRWLGHLTADVLEFVAMLNDLAGWFEEHPYVTEPLILALKAVIMPFQAAQDVAEKFKKWLGIFQGSQKAVWNEVDKGTDALKRNTNALVENAEQLQRQYDPTFNLIKAQEDLHKAHSAYDKAVKKHGPNSAQARKSLIALAKSAIALQIATGQAAGTFNGGLTPAMKATLRAAGLSSKEIRRLEKEFNDARAAGKRFARTYTARIKTIYHDVYKTTGQRVSGATGRGGHSEYRSGGIVGAARTGGIRGNEVMVGEEGAEIVELPVGSRVIPAGETRRRMSGQGQGGSGSVMRVEVVSDGSDFGEFLVKIIKKHIRFRWQGRVLDALGGGRA